jgi:hypothetical protein
MNTYDYETKEFISILNQNGTGESSLAKKNLALIEKL